MKIKLNDYIYSFFILSLIFVYFNNNSLNVDSTWILYSAKNMLNGEVLYKDIIDVNPPLIFIYSTIPVFIAKTFSINAEFVYILFILTIISISSFLSFLILKSVFEKKDLVKYYTLSIFTILSIFPTYDYGQREHLLIIFILPYILTMMFKEELNFSIKIILFISLFASLGFNIKPHFFLIFILIELVFIIHKKTLFSIFRIDFLIIVFSAFFYVLIITFLFPEYINNIVPLAIETYSDVFNKPYSFLLLKLEFFFCLFLSLYWLFFTKRDLKLPSKVLLSAIFASLVIYLLQQKGWSYHRLPLLLISLLFLAYISFSLFQKKKIYSITFLPIIIMILYSNIVNVPKFNSLQNIIDSLNKNEKIHITSVDIAQGQALLKDSQIWSSRFPSLFMLPSLLKNENKKIKDYTFNSIYSDLIKHNPKTIIIPSKKLGFDYYAYLTSNDIRIKKIYENYYKMNITNEYIILTKNKEYK